MYTIAYSLNGTILDYGELWSNELHKIGDEVYLGLDKFTVKDILRHESDFTKLTVTLTQSSAAT